MGLLLVLLFIVVPIAELYVIIQVGEWIGVWPTLLLLLLDAVVGSWLLKHEGRAAWRRFNEALAERRIPAKEVADGFLVILGGALLIAPGFITDIFGILFLIPPTRALARKVLYRFTVGRVAIVGFPGGPVGGGWGAGRRGGPEGGNGATRSYDYDVEAEEVGEDADFDHRLPPASD
ncbi:MAG TPA: FxsA family protein [Solirubrobacterales bacterium]|nr:FxsA family protein [Solirubrobacterales bacterium]